MLLRTVILGVLALGMIGCAAQPPTHYYDLTAVSAPAKQRLPQSVSLGIGPVTLPELLDQPGVVSRKGDTVVNVATYHIWAGELEPAFTRVLAENVARRLEHDRVWPSPWDNRFRPEYQVRIFVDRFSGEVNGEVVLNLTWSLLGDYGQELIRTQRYRGTVIAEGGYHGYVNALNQLLAAFSEQLASELVGQVPKL
ncbi:PqiC family protein [Pontibacterium granulatum]|uniref:PqiC family protein n=1 Tax=Pontibacterium granulatum TaxID=2036029 RepID=UPI00249CB86F|nr:PqiC family protein [Pontibacterium granulatum]MDI3324471.1 PqiC family protein [Pontibacterium granulatum]